MAGVDSLSGFFYFDPEDKIYLQHFPGNPVVPGSIIIDSFVKVLTKKKFISSGFTVNNFRFKKFIPPGEYRFTVSISESSFSCRLFSEAKAAVTGEIVS